MHLGLITTSWPSAQRPWAGHFIRDLALALVDEGARVTVLTPEWSGHGPLEADPRLEMIVAPLPGAPGSLAGDWTSGLRALWALRSAAKALQPDLWLCNWWPTRFAVAGSESCLAVLHGSDVDLLARLPSMVRRWIGHQLSCVAVAEGVAKRYARLTGQSRPPVCPMGARSSTGEVDKLPEPARRWSMSQRYRVLTAGRGSDSKGWRAVEGAQELMPDVDWLQVKPEHGIGPEGIRRLIALADLVVVPSEGGQGRPSEGRPHVIAQALVSGVPVVGGPNLAVREAMALFGQQEVEAEGSERLAEGVLRALKPDRHGVLKDRAREAGQALEWSSLGPRWAQIVRAAQTQPGHRRTTATPSC